MITQTSPASASTAAISRVLIVGGGFAGMSAAIALRRQGLAVDLVEIDPAWRSYGAGISLGGATLRAFRQLGVLEAFLEKGNASDDLELFLPDGSMIGRLPTPRLAGPDVPGAGAIMRPVLARVLAAATRAAGANVRLGCTFTAIEQKAESVKVSFTDGSAQEYDLLIGADGLYSKVRQAVFPEAPVPQYSGQGVWRAVLPRPPDVNTAMIWLGPVKPGLNPVSHDQMYLFLTEDRPRNEPVDPGTFEAHLKGLLAPFSAPLLQWVRDRIGPDSSIVFRPLEGLLMPRPWYRDRIVLIGDAVHATTPHLASGACIGIEDALVLSDELARQSNLALALDAFVERRWERCRMVVENSARLGDIEKAGGNKEEHARITRESFAALAQPI